MARMPHVLALLPVVGDGLDHRRAIRIAEHRHGCPTVIIARRGIEVLHPGLLVSENI